MRSCLVVEDSTVIRTIISEMLTEMGLVSVERQDAASAVEYCFNEHPAVVLLDWDLPNFGALDFLRGMGPMAAEHRPEILICATENDHQQFTLAKAAGASHHLLKPFDTVGLARKLGEMNIIDQHRIDQIESRYAPPEAPSDGEATAQSA